VNHVFDTHTSDMTLTEEQKDDLDSILANSKGLHVLTGTLGSGKSFFIKYII
jgi:type II secretory ATPase GspE/PulE/Tfp pilus assembly ATPase PilB-like protein